MQLAIRAGAAAVSLAGLVALALAIALVAPKRLPPIEPAPQVARRCTGWIASGVPDYQLVDIERVAPDDVWLLARGSLYRWDGCSWRAHLPFRPLAGAFIEWADLTRDAAGRMWLIGASRAAGRVRHGCIVDYRIPARDHAYVLEGDTWRSVAPALAPPRTRDRVFDADELGPERTIVVTSGPDADDQWAIVHAARRVYASDPRDGYGTATDHEVWRYDGRWTRVHAPVIDPPAPPVAEGYIGDMWIYGRGGRAPDNVWTVGYRTEDVAPEVRHFDGARWSSHVGRLPVEARGLRAVWSSGPREAWVVGEHGLVMHWDGAAWTVLPPPTFFELTSVRVDGGVLTVGLPGVTYRARLP